METTIEDLKTLILKKEDAYKKALEQMEIALIRFKDRSSSLSQSPSPYPFQIKKRSDRLFK